LNCQKAREQFVEEETFWIVKSRKEWEEQKGDNHLSTISFSMKRLTQAGLDVGKLE